MSTVVNVYNAIIDVYDAKTDEFIGRYMGIANTARMFNVDASSVSKCVKGRRKTAGGYKFKYADEGETITISAIKMR